MDKKQLSEADIRSKFIDPAIVKAGWSEASQIYREYTIAPGRIVVRGQKAQRNKQSALFADYLLCWQYGQPLAVVEAKDNTHSVGAGLQQATEYAERMGVPFAFSSNGDGFVFRDATLSDGELVREISLEEFPARKTCGSATAPGKAGRRSNARSMPLPTTRATATVCRATTSCMPSTARWRP